MKKTIALILAIVMMAAIAVPVFADVEIPTTEGVNNSTLVGAGSQPCVVSYGVTDSYTVSLPSEVSFSFTVNDQVAEVTVSNLVIDGNRKLVVTMGSDQGEGGVWQMQADNGSAPVPYTVTGATVDANADKAYVKPTTGKINNANLATPTTILEVESNVGGLGGTVELTFETEGTKQAGNYSDQITFVVALADKTPAQDPA